MLYYCTNVYLAHDVGEDGSRRSNQGADDGEQRLVQHEALRAQGPPRVRVQHRDHLKLHQHVHAYMNVPSTSL